MTAILEWKAAGVSFAILLPPPPTLLYIHAHCGFLHPIDKVNI